MVAPKAKVDYDEQGAGAADHDVAIVVLGENPYAEAGGDRSDLHLDEGDRNVLQTVLKTGVPTVVVANKIITIRAKNTNATLDEISFTMTVDPLPLWAAADAGPKGTTPLGRGMPRPYMDTM